MSINVVFKGRDFNDLVSALNLKRPYKMDEALNEVLNRVLYSIEQKAKQYVPVDTGHLQSMIQAVIYGNKTGAVIADTEYAAFVEYGTRYMRAQPYLRPAFLNTVPEISALLRLILPQKTRELFNE